VDFRAELRAACWFLLSWLALGVHLGILAASIGPGGPSTYLLTIGGMALATSLGILFLPAPAGAGVRDVILVVVLGSILTTGQALAIVVASRVILLACDVALAGVIGAATRKWRSIPAASKSANAGPLQTTGQRPASQPPAG
jgi:uncharacterized membrane protein YbhN (UPF0104 family)